MPCRATAAAPHAAISRGRLLPTAFGTTSPDRVIALPHHESGRTREAAPALEVVACRTATYRDRERGRQSSLLARATCRPRVHRPAEALRRPNGNRAATSAVRADSAIPRQARRSSPEIVNLKENQRRLEHQHESDTRGPQPLAEDRLVGGTKSNDSLSPGIERRPWAHELTHP
jgi:hypothetical protein